MLLLNTRHYDSTIVILNCYCYLCPHKPRSANHSPSGSQLTNSRYNQGAKEIDLRVPAHQKGLIANDRIQPANSMNAPRCYGSFRHFDLSVTTAGPRNFASRKHVLLRMITQFCTSLQAFRLIHYLLKSTMSEAEVDTGAPVSE